MIKGRNFWVIEAVDRRDVMTANIGHSVIVTNSRGGGSEIVIICSLLCCSVVVAGWAVVGGTPTGDSHSFFVKLLYRSIPEPLDSFSNTFGDTLFVTVSLGCRSKDQHLEMEEKPPEGGGVSEALTVG